MDSILFVHFDFLMPEEFIRYDGTSTILLIAWNENAENASGIKIRSGTTKHNSTTSGCQREARLVLLRASQGGQSDRRPKIRSIQTSFHPTKA